MIRNRKEALEGYKDLLSVKDLSAIFEVSRQTIYKEIHKGKFGETVQIGREYKVPKMFVLRHFFSQDSHRTMT